MLRVATRPGTYFDGTLDVTFEVTGVGADGEDGTSSAFQESSAGRGAEAVSFEVAFYHCDSGTFWKRADSSKPGWDEHDGTCELCTEADMDGEIEVRSLMGCGVRNPSIYGNVEWKYGGCCFEDAREVCDCRPL